MPGLTQVFGQCVGGGQAQAANPWPRCPFCGHAQALDVHRLARLQQYERDVEAQQLAAGDHASHLAGWQNAAVATSSRETWLSLAIFVICVIVSGLVGTVLAVMGLVKAIMVPGIAVVGGGCTAFVIVYIVAVLRAFRRFPSRGVQTAQVSVACPSCGAPATITAGAALERCPHCAAPLVASETIIEHGIHAATQERRRLAMMHYRMERITAASMYARGATFMVPLIALGPMALILLIAMLVVTGKALMGETEPWGVIVGWLVVFAVAGGLGALVFARQSRRARVAGSLDDLARQFAGRRLTGITDVVGWLNQYWAGPFPTQHLYVGPYYGAAALVADGYACLIDSNPTRSDHMVTRLQVLIAAATPPDLQGEASPSLHPEVARLVSEGFAVRFEEAGLVATAGDAWVKAVGRRPEALHALAPIVMRTTRLARALGAMPVGAIP